MGAPSVHLTGHPGGGLQAVVLAYETGLFEIDPGHKLACFNPVPAEEWERTRMAATA